MSEANESPVEAKREDGRALVQRLSRGVDLLVAAEILSELNHLELSREVAEVGHALIASASGKVAIEATAEEPKASTLTPDERALEGAIVRMANRGEARS